MTDDVFNKTKEWFDKSKQKCLDNPEAFYTEADSSIPEPDWDEILDWHRDNTDALWEYFRYGNQEQLNLLAEIYYAHNPEKKDEGF